MIRIQFFLVLFLLCSSALAQECVLTGTVVDKNTGEGLPNANVFYGNGQGFTCDFDGKFEQTLPYGRVKFEFSYVGYSSKVIEVNLNKPKINLNVELISIELQEALILADVAIDRKTPVAYSNIEAKQFEEELGSQEVPMILNSTPGVYATQQGGGDGDARITIRGFDQRNVAVLLDGVPVNDMENGAVYWSNWFGLDAIMQTTQVQRGLGVSKLAIPAIGGTINIITKGIEQKKNTRIKQEVGNNGFLRTTVGHTSGRLKGNWGFTVAGSYKQGDGWVYGNWTEGYFYYGKFQKAFNKHVFTLSGFGAPQSHGQRSFREGVHIYDQDFAADLGVNTSGFEEFGLNYNIHATELERYELDAEGNKINAETETFNERKNYYHKPQFSFKHSWNPSEKFNLSNVAYLSIGNGGGTRLDSQIDSILINGQPFVQAVYDAHTGLSWDPGPFGLQDPAIIPEISQTERNAYRNFIKSSINNHFWYGLLSTANWNVNEEVNISGGIDLRSYRGEHYREVYDLLGADYTFNKEGDNQNRNSGVFRVGDKIDYHNDAFVEWGGLFGQVEIDKDLWSGFFSASYAMTRYKRIDYFLPRGIQVGDEFLTPSYVWNDDFSLTVPQAVDTMSMDGTVYSVDSDGLEFQETDWFYRGGFTIKTGFNYKLNEKQNVFVNLGYLDRAPRFANVFDFGNRLFLDIQNEKIQAIELGYSYHTRKFKTNFNSYFTTWKNRPVNRGVSIPDPEDPLELISANINDMAARHMGVELESSYAVNSKLTVESIISIGDWIWNSKDTVFFFYDNGAPVIITENITVLDENGDPLLDGEGNPITEEVSYQESRNYDAEGVHVGDAAQTQLGLMLRYQFRKGTYAKFRYTYFDRHFANFDPLTLNGENAGRDSWQAPSYGLLDAHFGYEVKTGASSFLNLRLSVFNVLNTVFISDASNNFSQSRFNDYAITDELGNTQAQGFDAGSAGVFFGQGTRFNVSATLNF